MRRWRTGDPGGAGCDGGAFVRAFVILALSSQLAEASRENGADTAEQHLWWLVSDGLLSRRSCLHDVCCVCCPLFNLPIISSSFSYVWRSPLSRPFFSRFVREEDENATPPTPPTPPCGNVASPPVKLSQSVRLFGPPGQHMEPSKLVFNFPAAVVKSAALTAALRELIRNPRA